MFMTKFQSQTDKAQIYVVTPVMIAWFEEHLGVVRVRLLSRKDIDTNDENEDKDTALMYSCDGGNIEIVRCLLDHENIDVERGGAMDSPCFRKCTKTVIKKSVLKETVIEDFVIARNLQCSDM